MESETISQYSFDKFSEADPLTGPELPDLVREEDPKALARDNNGFVIAGLLGLVAGAGLMVATNTGGTFHPIFPAFLVAGVGAGLFGLSKAYLKIFRKKKLSLPSLTVKRKVVKNTAPAMVAETFKSRKLRKSFRNKVFMGVADGLARYLGKSPALIRLLFIMAFFFSGGMISILYFGLAFWLDTDYKK